MIAREAKGLKRYRAYMGSQMDCGDEGCGYCRVCRRLDFLEWAGMVAPRDIPCSISPSHDVDAQIARKCSKL